MTFLDFVSLLPSPDRSLRAVGLTRTSHIHGTGQSLGAFALGLLVGAGVGLLLAPMTGRELREKVQSQLHEHVNGHDTAPVG